ncbi:MAG: hypothetical protein UV38_C0003G0130 [candidate division TM6 bacterium GW2011_GWE2_42_60]|nr:MAG: hypothetical protein UV38_C0003G0130 [candidate division TM6 bacterium GW2011_GWE2_42_60]HBY05391.1 hypothetical protein [Candidatus Dependentiae bacterium]
MNLLSDFVVFQSTYKTLALGLFRHGELCQRVSGESKEMSGVLLVQLDELLKKESLTVRDLTFMGVHVGPGPFTTIRTLVAYANGLAFSSGVPLIEIDGFEAFFKDLPPQQSDYTVIIFNAFCQELFYAIRTNRTGVFETGILSFAGMAELLRRCAPLTVQIAGQGVSLFKAELDQLRAAGLEVEILPQEAVSLEAMGAQAFEQWRDESKRVSIVLPRYLKQCAK